MTRRKRDVKRDEKGKEIDIGGERGRKKGERKRKEGREREKENSCKI